tara:strand:+ start:1364 stop:1567 length:204 start_codon:yes stop_codon:yes gene_type:complete
MTKKVPHDLLIGEKYTDKPTGEEKTSWHKVGVAFALETGGFSCKVLDGLAVTGEFIIKERTAKDAEA